MKKYIKNFFKNKNKSHYFVAASGGVDSMVLLHLMHSNAIPITVLHVNYHLRDEESIGDALFIENYCRIHSIAFEKLDFDMPNFLVNNGGNLQNEARKIRYNFFSSEISKHTDSQLVTAHHLNDQIETFWLQLFRGSGITGMSGMNLDSEIIARPLLPFSKSQIQEYALKEGLTWREDSSNFKPNYFRNFLRLKALPYLKSEIPDIDEHVILLQKVFKTESELQKKYAKSLVKKWESKGQIELKDFDVPLIQFHEALKICNIPSSLMDSIYFLRKAENGKRVLIENKNAICNELRREKNCVSLIKESIKLLYEFKVSKTRELPKDFSLLELYLDGDLIHNSLDLRPWKADDIIFPVGMNGSKKISQLLKEKLDQSQLRINHQVLVSGNDVIGIPGISVNRNFIAQNKTKNILKITFTKC